MYLHTKFRASIVIHSKVMESVPNFKSGSRDRDHAHFRGQFVMLWLEHVVFDEPNTKFLSSTVPKI